MRTDEYYPHRPKMYRTRIRRWGIDKNNKGSEVAYMLRLKKQRDTQGKKSSFFIRNRPVDWYASSAILSLTLLQASRD